MSKLSLLTRFFFRTLFGASPGVAFGLLATPAALISFALNQKYSPLAQYGRKQVAFDSAMQSLTDKYLFIAVCMTAAGLVAALRSDSLFPDRRDYANLAPLPVDLRELLLAKAIALAGFLFSVVIAMNVVSSVVFPAVVLGNTGTFSQYLRFVFAHALALSAAGLFTFCSVLAVQGTLMSLLPYAWFTRLKRYVQFGWVMALLGMLLATGPAMKEITLLRTGFSSWAEWLPAMWFLGLYQMVQGVHMGDLSALWPRALQALPAAAVLAAGAYALSYRWYFLRSAESAGGALRTFRVPDPVFRALDAIVFRTGFDRGCFRFIARTVARSDRHSAAFAAIMGVGVSLAVLSVTSGNLYGILTANLIVIYSLMTALRFSFGITADLEAMWIFRTAANPEADPQRIVKRSMLCFAGIPILLSTIGIAFMESWISAVWHLIFLCLASVALVDLLTIGFRAVPFTCSWLPYRNNTIMPLAVWVAGLAFFGPGLAGIERVLLQWPGRLTWFLVVVAIVIVACRRTESTKQPVAWSDTRGEFELLHITD